MQFNTNLLKPATSFKKGNFIIVSIKMDQRELVQLIKTINSVNQLKKNEKLDMVRDCPEHIVHSICECCHNLVKDYLPLNRQKKYRARNSLRPIRHEVRELADSETSAERKRELLSDPQVGGGVFTILASTILPALISALIPK